MKVIFNNKKVDQWGNVFHVDRNIQVLDGDASYGLYCSVPMVKEVEYTVTPEAVVISTSTIIVMDEPYKGDPIVFTEDGTTHGDTDGPKGRIDLPVAREEEVRNQPGGTARRRRSDRIQ